MKEVRIHYKEIQNLLANRLPTSAAIGCLGWKYDIYYAYGCRIYVCRYGRPARKAHNIKDYAEKARRLNPLLPEYFDEIEKILAEFCKQA